MIYLFPWLDVGMALLAGTTLIIPEVLARNLRRHPVHAVLAFSGIVAFWPLMIYYLVQASARYRRDS